MSEHDGRLNDKETGISIRFIRQFDIQADQTPPRPRVWWFPDDGRYWIQYHIDPLADRQMIAAHPEAIAVARLV